MNSVTEYSTKSGMLYLEHSQPSKVRGRPHKQPQAAVAVVDVTLLLENLKATDTQIGEWVTVVGYVDEKSHDESGTDVRVKALLLWSAGAINISGYEAAVTTRKRYGQPRKA
ncbi:hypothetical protein MMC34_002344 [Xylographa carneopallida]|nr:hypothetical protein [Xylographa carneopallida]